MITSDEEDEKRLKKACKEAIATKLEKQKLSGGKSKRKDAPRATKRPFLGSSGRGSRPATKSTREGHRWWCRKKGTTTAFVVLTYHPSTPQGLGHQSTLETYSHNSLTLARALIMVLFVITVRVHQLTTIIWK